MNRPVLLPKWKSLYLGNAAVNLRGILRIFKQLTLYNH